MPLLSAAVNDAAFREPVSPSEDQQVPPVMACREERPGVFSEFVNVRLNATVALRRITHKIQRSDGDYNRFSFACQYATHAPRIDAGDDAPVVSRESLVTADRRRHRVRAVFHQCFTATCAPLRV